MVVWITGCFLKTCSSSMFNLITKRKNRKKQLTRFLISSLGVKQKGFGIWPKTMFTLNSQLDETISCSSLLTPAWLDCSRYICTKSIWSNFWLVMLLMRKIILKSWFLVYKWWMQRTHFLEILGDVQLYPKLKLHRISQNVSLHIKNFESSSLNPSDCFFWLEKWRYHDFYKWKFEPTFWVLAKLDKTALARHHVEIRCAFCLNIWTTHVLVWIAAQAMHFQWAS